MNIILSFTNGTTTTIENVTCFYPSDLENDCYLVISEYGVNKYSNVDDFHCSMN